MTRQTDLAKIHMAKKQLGLDDDTYRQILWQVGKVESAADLDLAGRSKLIQHFKDKGWKPKRSKKYSPKSRHKDEKNQADKIRALWITMHNQGIVRDGSEQALNHYINRMVAVAQVGWLHGKKANTIIESLKQWQARALAEKG